MKEKKIIKIKTTLTPEEEKQRIKDKELKQTKYEKIQKKYERLLYITILPSLILLFRFFLKTSEFMKLIFSILTILLFFTIVFLFIKIQKNIKKSDSYKNEPKFYSRMALLEIKDVISIVELNIEKCQSREDIWNVYYTFLSDVNKEVYGIRLYDFQIVVCDSEESVIDLDNFKVFVPITKIELR